MPANKNQTQYDFQKMQYAFTAHIRQPDINAIPENIEDRRMKIYSQLFYNNDWYGITLQTIKPTHPYFLKCHANF